LEKELSDSIKSHRKSNKISQKVLAEKLSVSQKTVCNWEKGTEPMSSNLMQLTALLNMYPEQLVQSKKKKFKIPESTLKECWEKFNMLSKESQLKIMRDIDNSHALERIGKNYLSLKKKMEAFDILHTLMKDDMEKMDLDYEKLFGEIVN